MENRKAQKICAVCGEGAVINPVAVVCEVQCWRFVCWTMLLWLGRPIEVDSEQIETLIQNSLH